MKTRLTLNFLILLLLVSCASIPVNVIVADFETQQSAANFQVPRGKARVYFVGGRSGNAISLKAAMVGGAELLINGFSVGQIDRNDVLVIDITSGDYTFSWKYPSGDSITELVQKEISVGEIILLQANWNTGFGIASPAKYELSEVYDKAVFSNKRIVLPTRCPQSICTP
jgi:hypothetical protein